MDPYPGWQYNEIKQVGTDYSDTEEVRIYDQNMQKVRDIGEEIRNIISCTGLKGNQTVIEFGTGTGEFALEAAKFCNKVYAVDVSTAMLEYARKKARIQGIKNIVFCHAGFLTYEHEGEQPDVVVSQLALHHLPDFWKMIALRRIFNILKNGGRFYLRDTVYSFEVDNYRSFFNNWLEDTQKFAGDGFARDTAVAIRDEFSTLDWIMESLLKRAGFSIDRAEYPEGFMAVYVCTKRK